MAQKASDTHPTPIWPCIDAPTSPTLCVWLQDAKIREGSSLRREQGAKDRELQNLKSELSQAKDEAAGSN